MSLSPVQSKQNRMDFLDILTNTTEIPKDNPKFMNYLEISDFYQAPASTKYHDSHEGGLLVHSLKTYENLLQLNYQKMLGFSDRSVAITALFHDICKVDFYRKTLRNQRMEDGTWKRVQTYMVEDQLPVGHGEKSAIILLNYQIKLTEEELLAIRWHMGGWDASAQNFAGGQALSNAYGKYKLPAALHLADMMATWL